MAIATLKNRVAETAPANGTSNFALAGAIGAQYQSFNGAGLDASPTYYFAVNRNAAEFEWGIGTSSAGTLTRTTILGNHLGTTAKVSFSTGTLEVFVDVPAEKMVSLDTGTSALTLPGALVITGALSGVTSLAMGGALSGATTGSFSSTLALGGDVTITKNGAIALNFARTSTTANTMQLVNEANDFNLYDTTNARAVWLYSQTSNYFQITPTTIIGADPGGSQILRVGGAANINGALALAGALTGATTGAFSGAVSMAGLTATTGTFSGAVSGITTLASGTHTITGGLSTTTAITTTTTGAGGTIYNGQDNAGYGAYLQPQVGLNFDYGVNATTEAWINYVGYQGGGAQFRSLSIGDGKSVRLAQFNTSGSGNIQLGYTAGVSVITIGGSGYGAGVASVRLNGLTNGAGSSAGTLTNAPSAGNPNFWIPVSIAGTVRYVPAW